MSNHARNRTLRNHPVTKVVGTSGTILSLGAALVAVSPGTAGAATIQVTSTADDGAGSLITLREAIETANGTPSADDVITFAPGLTGPITLLAGSGGRIEITDALNIQGPGATLLTVDGDDNEGIFYVAPDAGNFSISGLTLTKGNSGDDGGAIYSETTGAVTLTNLMVTHNNASDDGGGVGIDHAASVTITGTTFDHNYADENGGGVNVYDADGTVSITGSTFTDNHADYYGGGLQIYDNKGASTVSGSTFHHNYATKGGGISVYELDDGTLAITGSTIDHNYATYGGGIRINQNEDNVSIALSTIADNHASEAGGGINIYETSGDVTITSSTISGNYALSGGGVYAYFGGTLTITNSTISGNYGEDRGGGIAFAYYGEDQGGLVLTHSTVTDNETEDGGDGGGLYLADGTDATIDHTIIAGNTVGGDVVGEGSAELSNSLIGDADLGSVTVTDGGNNTFSTDPMLGPLADNGGPTQTHALLAGSPALNSGDPAFTPPPSTDQRGEPRVAFVVIDKGAYEAQPDEEEPRSAPPAEPVPGAANFTG